MSDVEGELRSDLRPEPSSGMRDRVASRFGSVCSSVPPWSSGIIGLAGTSAQNLDPTRLRCKIFHAKELAYFFVEKLTISTNDYLRDESKSSGFAAYHFATVPSREVGVSTQARTATWVPRMVVIKITRRCDGGGYSVESRPGRPSSKILPGRGWEYHVWQHRRSSGGIQRSPAGNGAGMNRRST
jgi:hypothetical protein